MISKGIVLRIIDANYAEVSVTRQSACGENCGSCSGCDKPTHTAISIAKNTTDAKVGDVVNLKTETKKVLKGAVYIYILPLILFFVFFLISSILFENEITQNYFSVFGFIFGIYIAWLYSKKLAKEDISIEIF